MVMQNSEGENKVHYGLYESSDYKRCKACVKLNYLTDNLVPRSPRSCGGLRKWRLRDGPTWRAQEGPLKLPDERQSLKRKENWWKLLLLGIQTGDKLAKPPFFVVYSRLCRHCRNWPKEVVACRNFILGSVATFWVMSLVGIYPGRASKLARWKGKNLSIEGMRKGYFFCQKCYILRVKGWTSGRGLPV